MAFNAGMGLLVEQVTSGVSAGLKAVAQRSAQPGPIEVLAFALGTCGVLLSWTTRHSEPSRESTTGYNSRLRPKMNLFLLGMVLFPGILGLGFPFLTLSFGLLWLYLAPKPAEFVMVKVVASSAFNLWNRNGEKFLESFLKLARELGASGTGEAPSQDTPLPDMLRFDMKWCGFPDLYIPIAPSYVKTVLTAPSHTYFEHTAANPLNLKILRRNLLTIKHASPDDSLWKIHRTLTSVVNMDHTGNDSFVAGMFDVAARTMVRMVRQIKGDSRIPLRDFLDKSMIYAHIGALFGEKYNEKTWPTLWKDTELVYEGTGKQVATLSSGMWPWFGIKHRMAYKRLCVWADDVASSKPPSSPFMSYVLKGYERGDIDHEEVIGTIFVFLFAIAPVHSAFWSIILLANNPREQGELFEELQSVLSSDKGDNFPSDVLAGKEGCMYDRLTEEAPLLEKVVNESLRLFPPVPSMFPRSALRDVMLGPWSIPKGSTIITIPWIAHRNAASFEKPDEFILDRDISPSRLGEGTKFFPFGHGPRVCQGQFFAQCFIKLSLAAVLSEYEVIATGPIPAATLMFFCVPMRDVDVILKKRKQPQSSYRMAPAGSGAEEKARAPANVRKLPAAVKAPPTAAKTDAAKKKAQEVEEGGTLVLYGTTSGTSRSLAERLGLMGHTRLKLDKVQVKSMDSCTSFKQLSACKTLFIVAATFNSGTAPVNGIAFGDMLMAAAQEQKDKKPLAGVRYAVLALGSSVYPASQFCKFGADCHHWLKELGAHPLLPVTKCDELENQSAIFIGWTKQLEKQMKESGSVEASSTEEPQEEGGEGGFFELVEQGHGPSRMRRLDEAAAGDDGKVCATQSNPVLARVVHNVPLKSVFAKRQARKVTLEFPPECHASYEPGDYLGIFPSNNPDSVHRLARRLGIANLDTVISFSTRGGSSLELENPLPGEMTYWAALSHYVQIEQPPRPEVFAVLAKAAGNPKEKAELEELAEGEEKYMGLVVDVSPSLLEVLDTFPSSNPNVGALLQALPKLRPRMYSISSLANEEGPLRVDLTVAAVQYAGRANPHDLRLGLCSSFLGSHTMIPSSEHDDSATTAVFIVKQPMFRPPKDPKTPVLYVCAGVGIAPFRSFWQHRQKLIAQGVHLGPAALYVGMQNSKQRLYPAELEEALKVGALTDVKRAYSREGKCHYVQDLVLDERQTIWEDWLMKGGEVYICGTVNVAKALKEAVIEIAMQVGDMDQAQAQDWFRHFKKEGRWHEDVFGESTDQFVAARAKAKIRRALAKVRVALKMQLRSGRLQKLVAEAQ